MKRFTYVLPLAKTLLIKAAQLHLRSAAPPGQVMHLPRPLPSGETAKAAEAFCTYVMNRTLIDATRMEQ